MKLLKFSFLALLATSLLFMGCEDDDGAEPISITAISATGTDLQSGNSVNVDLNAAAAATDVPLDAVITITFAKEVDAATVDNTSITLTESGSAVDASVSASGSNVTVSPNAVLDRGTVYTLTITSAVAAADGGQFSETTRQFTTAGRAEVVPPQEAKQLAYFNFNGTVNSVDGAFVGEGTGITYGEDRLGNQGSAATFDGDVSIAEISGGDDLLKDRTSFTWSYWVKIDTNNHVGGHFVSGLGSTSGFFMEVFGNLSGMKLNTRYTREDGSTVGNDFFFNGDGMDANNGGWVGVEFEVDLSGQGGLASLLADQWAHIVWVYDGVENKRHLYINGERMETDNLNNTSGLNDLNGVTFDSSAEEMGGETIGTDLTFGFLHDRSTTKWANEPWGGYMFPDANHFKGSMDDVRFFDAALIESEVKELYNAEKP
jgi:hypothetical protein